MILNVCKKLGKVTNMSPVAYRVMFVLGAILYGTGLFLYFILAIIFGLSENPKVKELLNEEEK